MIYYKHCELFGDIPVDTVRIGNARYGLMEGYKRKDVNLIKYSARLVQEYVDAGFDDVDGGCPEDEDYEGHDPYMLAQKYIASVFINRYVDSNHDQHYIKTGLLPYMLNWGRPQPKQLELFN